MTASYEYKVIDGSVLVPLGAQASEALSIFEKHPNQDKREGYEEGLRDARSPP